MKYQVKVKPGSKRGSFVQASLTGELLVHVSEPAIDGKANRAVIALLADYFDVPKNQVRITGGYTSRLKIIEVLE